MTRAMIEIHSFMSMVPPDFALFVLVLAGAWGCSW
jgi:hypothetical protein